MKHIAAILLLFFSIGETVSAQDLSTLTEQVDSLYTHFAEEKALELYDDILARDSTNFEALWRCSFLYSRIGNRKDNEESKRSYFKKALTHAERALEVDSAHTQSNFVMAVAMGRKALISGTKERVAASRAIKKYADLAIKYDSSNAGAWHVLGRWNYQLANLSFFERLAANTLFGGIPSDASNAKAVEFLKRAVMLNDRYVLYHHDLAKALNEAGQKAAAISACETALKKENITAKDDELKSECRRWINKWK